MNKKHIITGFVLTILLFAVHLVIIDDYGITWDFHHHFFAGLYHLGIPLKESLTKNIPFTMPDPRGTYDLPFGPLMLIAPTITYQIFHEWLGLLAFDNAYHLSIIVSGVAGVFILYLFLLEAFGLATALAGFAFLALLPRYFGDLHNNMKDVPQAAAFALAIYMFWRLARYKRLKDLILATLAFAIAFNTKVNTLLVPVIAGMWMFLTSIKGLVYRGKDKSFFIGHWSASWRMVIGYFLLAPLMAFLLWLPFWKDPIDRLIYMFRFFLDNTLNLEVLYFGTIYKSAINVPWHYALGYLGVTTPIPTLIFFLIGILIIVWKLRFEIWDLKKATGLLLLLWFFLPLTRYLNPKIGVIDGIRHFEEVVFPLAAIAAVGAVNVMRRMSHMGRMSLMVIILLSLILPIVRYHPYQISYFNELVASNATTGRISEVASNATRAFLTGAGGIRGAWKNFDVEYWGTSQKAAMRWLNANAPKDSYVHVLMAGDSAAKYLRPDLLARVNKKGFDEADYVVVLNRQSFFNRYWGITDYMPKHKIAYTVSVQGVPLTLIYDNKLGLVSPPAFPWWEKPNSPTTFQIP
ncbi:MAG: glycosyltransferase family 39 protein [Candidatus Gottesmanbacteria bacterium]|nr:glycosyltransferase family 39 protein [Candidatus Gottesmanbacteria bacterium]